MRIAVVNTFDVYGGAARTANRLHNGLIDKGFDCKMVVQIKQSDNKLIIGPETKFEKLKNIIFSYLSNFPLKFYPKKDSRTFSTGFLNSTNLNKYQNDFDILNLHWVANGFQGIISINKIKTPLVLSLHDSWAFTGGCHIPFTCEKFTQNCGDCECLNSKNNYDLSYHILNSKKKYWKKKKLVLIAASNWIAENARRSSVFKDHRIEVINPGLDLKIYKPQDKIISRNLFGLSESDNVILFGAISATSDFNKGFHLLIPALEKLEYILPNLKLLVFGSNNSGDLKINNNLPIKYVGRLHDDISLTLLYSAADVMVVPSIQEAFGQTASESFACGTPVVAFGTSGLLDIIDHKINGYLARPYDSTDLAEGIKWVIEDKDRLKNLSQEARNKAVKNFSLDIFVNKYLEVYRSILKNNK
jgi:glycosyltransferase involved in cell wall biosynthesis